MLSKSIPEGTLVALQILHCGDAFTMNLCHDLHARQCKLYERGSEKRVLRAF